MTTTTDPRRLIVSITTDDTVRVIDPAGGVWHPDEDTTREILLSEDPEAAARDLVRNEPARGTWRQ